MGSYRAGDELERARLILHQLCDPEQGSFWASVSLAVNQKVDQYGSQEPMMGPNNSGLDPILATG